MRTLALGAAGVQIARAQQSCGVSIPANDFSGVVGRSAADSKPALLTPARARAGSPNVIYIVLDDTGFSDLHCFGSEISTPNIDALGAGGVIFSNFHTKAVCSPSRAALLTGRNSHAVGMKELPEGDNGYPNGRGRVSPAAATVAQILGTHGYSTMGVGKWHLVPNNGPNSEMKASASRENWPLQKGFDRWYGFLSGWTDQYHPDLIEDNHSLPKPNDPNYHFSVDIIDHAIKMVAEQKAADANKPFFLHVAFGATHSPIQVPKRYIDKYVSTFAKGWDKIREERFQRQLEREVIPPGTKLPPRNAGDPAWDELSGEERAVFARFMATFAGFLEHADEQVGRLVKYLKEQNLFDNTLIFLLSDNGGAPEAGPKGGFYGAYNDKTTVHEMFEHLDELGTDKTSALYQRAWAMASDTPFQYYKLWPYRGGVQTPLIVSWPKGIQTHGWRRQFVDIIDITPTVLDVVGVGAPPVFQGVCQIPLQGKSIRAVLNDPQAPNPRNAQYFELWGSRGIWQDGWEAVAIHKPGTDFDTDRWELYHVDTDFSQTVNVAAQYPERLAQMKQVWWSEASKNGALPLLEAPGFRRNTYDQALPK